MQPGRKAQVAPETSIEGSVFTALALRLGASTVDHWFRGNTTIVERGDELSVRANSPFLLSWIQRHYKDALRAVAADRLGASARVVFDSGLIGDGSAAKPASSTCSRADASLAGGGDTVAAVVGSDAQETTKAVVEARRTRIAASLQLPPQ